MIASLTDIKQQKIKTLIGETLQSKKLKIRQIVQILGTFEASLPVIKFGCLNMFYLQKYKNEALKLKKGNYEGFINLTENCISELQWWNTATLAWINRQNAPNETIHLLLKEFWEFCAEKQI